MSPIRCNVSHSTIRYNHFNYNRAQLHLMIQLIHLLNQNRDQLYPKTRHNHFNHNLHLIIKPSQTKPETAVPKYKTQSSQPQPELVTFDSKMKERHNIVRNIMTVLRQQKKENADTYKPKISHQRNGFQSLVYIFQIRRFCSLSLSG